MTVGILAAPGPTTELARKLARNLTARLGERFPGHCWRVELETEMQAGPVGSGEDMVRMTRKRLLHEAWQLAICLTDLPVHVGRRPVTAHVSVSLRVGVVSVPALGPVEVDKRLEETVLRIVEGALYEQVPRHDAHSADTDGHLGMRQWLEKLTSPVGRPDEPEQGTFRLVTAATRGNIRLLAGMVRANQPWKLVSGLSRALVAALGTAAAALTSPGIWRIADGMGAGRLTLLTVGSLLAIGLTLILVHGLWENTPDGSRRREIREQVMLFNLATMITVTIGILTLYLAQFLIVLLVGLALITPGVLENELKHPVGPVDYMLLSWLAASMAVVGGALGAALENEDVVRAAAYGYHPDEPTEAGHHENREQA
ncbi:hypothetical protein LDL08_07685 [Nonomuraea glycinis]|uniref:Uncharacterized protein n=1 Tax=Nonomuraea glycinis TaxID=2047744 RepID=A0A918AH08_9ACTN|nr:hypothetical protein [Nonomuraea glycinis]MCA2176057.1 hypothetical protein [Nonomuraea glycinis]GGP18024.1 hypothetical protein GCM10012278_88720 [Nonomuraea glycinis]